MMVPLLVAFALAQAFPGGGVGLVGNDPPQGQMPGTNAPLEMPHWGSVQERQCLADAAAKAERENRRVTLEEQKHCATGGAPAASRS